MSSHTVINADGLNTTANPIGSVAKGSAAIADNCVVREKDIYEPRRGQRLFEGTFPNLYDRAKAVFFFNGVPIYQYGDSFLAQEEAEDLNFFDFTGPFAPPAPETLRMKSAVANEKFFFTTSEGIKVLPEVYGTPQAAGIPKPFNVETLSVIVDVSTFNWLPTANQIGVRVCFGIRDERGGVQLGPVSELAVLTNSSGSDRSLSVHVGIPADITTANVYRVFMTDASGSASVDPGDECYLAYEGAISAANITAGHVVKQITIVESVTSDIPLYTNPNTGDGIESSKQPAPYAKDITYWNGSLWAFGVKRKQTFRMTLLGAAESGAGTGISGADGSIVTVNDVAYTFLRPGPYTGAVGEVLVDNQATAALTIAFVAKDFAVQINRADPLLRAYYVPSADGWPGEIVIEEAGHGADPFTVYGDSDNFEAFAPQLPVTEQTALESTADDFGNWAWHTPADEPEAWPLANFIPAGKRGASILRGAALKDGLYLFMDDATIQVIRGAGGQYRVDELDSTAQLIGPDTVAVGNNQIFALTSQGVCTIGEGGVGVIGLPIEADVRTLFGPALETTKLISFGFVYESERSYCVALPTRSGQTVCQQIFAYNYFTKAWTRWPVARSCAGVNPVTDVLHMGDGNSNGTRIERKTFTNDDYCDESFAVTISAATGTTLTLASTAGISAGDMIQQGDSMRAVVTAVTNATTLTVHSEEDWDLAAATVYVAFASELQWSPATMGAPGILKNASEMTLHFLEASFVRAENTITTDQSAEPASVQTMQRTGWGSRAWGEFPWGEPSGPCNERGGIPIDKRSASYFHPRFYIREAKSSWRLLGYTLEHEPISTRTAR